MWSSLFALVLTLASDPNPPAAVEPSTRLFDLSAILQPRGTTLGAVPTLPAAVQPRSFAEPESAEQNDVTADVVLDLLRQCVAPEEWEFEGRSLQLVEAEHGMWLRATAPEARLADVERFLTFLAGAVAGETAIVLDVHRVRADAARALSALPADAASVAELVRAGALSAPRTFPARLFPGRVERVALQRSHSYVSHFSVEIAEAAARVQPIPRAFETGTVALLRGDVLEGGNVLVRFVVSDSELAREPQPIDLKTEAQFVSERGSETVSARCVLQNPELRFATIAGSAELAAGQSVVVAALDPTAVGTDHAGIVAVLRVEHVAPASASFECDGRETRILHVAFSALDALTLPNPSQAASGDHEEDPPAWIGLGSFHGSNLLEGAVDASRVYDMDDVACVSAGPIVALVGKAGGGADGVPGAAARLVAALLRPSAPIAVELACARDGRSSPIALLSCGREGAMAVAGGQENYVTGYEVDVANRSSIAQPNTSMLPSAWAARVFAGPAAPLGRRVRVEFRGHLRDGAKRVVDPQVPMLGIMHAADFLESAIDATRAVGAAGADFGAIELERDRVVTLRAHP